MGVAFRVFEHAIPQGVSLEPLDRFVGRDGSLVTADMVDTIDLRIFTPGTEDPLYELLDIDPGDGTTGPWFDELQTDGRWQRAGEALDRRGYNSRHLVTPADLEAEGVSLASGSVYRLELIVHTEPWEDLVSVHEYTIERIYGAS